MTLSLITVCASQATSILSHLHSCVLLATTAASPAAQHSHTASPATQHIIDSTMLQVAPAHAYNIITMT